MKIKLGELKQVIGSVLREMTAGAKVVSATPDGKYVVELPGVGRVNARKEGDEVKTDHALEFNDQDLLELTIEKYEEAQAAEEEDTYDPYDPDAPSPRGGMKAWSERQARMDYVPSGMTPPPRGYRP